MIRSYRELDVWGAGCTLACSVYRVTRGFPREERFGVTDQMRRAAVSVPANIAEGHARFGRGEYLHHVSIACGSLAELETLIILASRVDLVPAHVAQDLLSCSGRVGQMLSRLRRRLSEGGQTGRREGTRGPAGRRTVE